MLMGKRKQEILQILAREKQVQSGELSRRFDISEDSIRRDLRELAAEGLLQRVHGGALPVSAAIASLEIRKSVQTDEKRAIAQRGASLIRPGQVVIIDGGTTTSMLIPHIPRDLAFTAVTHSPGIAMALLDHPQTEVILIGGTLYKHSAVSVGATTLENIQRLSADLFFMGVTGVHSLAGFTTGNYEEAGIKRALSGRAAETVVMASAEKLGAASPFTVGPLSAASALIVASEPDSALLAACVKYQVSLISC